MREDTFSEKWVLSGARTSTILYGAIVISNNLFQSNFHIVLLFTIQDEFILETDLSSFSFLHLFVTRCSFVMLFSSMATTVWWCSKLFQTLILSLKQHSTTLSLVSFFRVIFQASVMYSKVWGYTLSVWSCKGRSSDCNVITYDYAL